MHQGPTMQQGPSGLGAVFVIMMIFSVGVGIFADWGAALICAAVTLLCIGFGILVGGGY